MSHIDDLGAEYLATAAAANPFFATNFGLPGHDAEVPEASADSQDELARTMTSIHDRAAALDVDALDATDRASRALVLHDSRALVDAAEARMSEWQLGSLVGPVYAVLGSVPKVTLTHLDKAEDYAARCARLPGYIDGSTDALRSALDDGFVAARQVVDGVITTLDAYLATSADDDPLLAPLAAVADTGVRGRVEDSVRRHMRPALIRMRDALATEIAPHARPDDQCGVLHLPGGAEIYRRLVGQHTTTDATPQELHETGLRLAEELQAELADRGGRVLGTSDVSEVTRRLRADAGLCYTAGEEMLADARDAVRRAEAAVPDWFGRAHTIGCDVEAMNAAEAETSALGYYQPPADDGSRPGRYWLNTSRPTTRPRYELETLTFHESVPGHHMQFAMARGLADLPAYRRFAYVTAYGEGWGLYCERLADEMGLYSHDLARFGMVSFDAWRAARLVVDTGVHYLGWSRAQAVDYMWANTCLTMGNIVNEVDRYISMPGQALAYMTGRLELVRLREDARQSLGAAFDVRGFHDVVLGTGSIPLTHLADEVRRWTAAEPATY